MSGEVSFEVKQEALAVVRGLSIEANFEEVKAWLTEAIEPYKSAIVTEDGISGAKADRAKIRKVAERIEQVRKTVKAEYNKSLAPFEAKCKELVAICDDGSGNLDRQVKAFEEREREAKLNDLRADYDSYGGDEARAYCPWERIFNPKWGNKGYSAEAAKGEIHYFLDETADNLRHIRSFGGEDAAYLLDTYKATRDMGAVMRKAGELAETRKAEEARREAKEARRRATEEARGIEAEKRAAAVTHKQETAEPDDYYEQPFEPDAPEKVYSVSFRVHCTKDKLAALGRFMKDNGISFEKV